MKAGELGQTNHPGLVYASFSSSTLGIVSTRINTLFHGFKSRLLYHVKIFLS